MNPTPRKQKRVFSDCSYNELRSKITSLDFDSIDLVKGYFSKTLDKYKNNSFSLVHLDCDLYDSYKECLNFFYDRVSPGGFIVFDEYDYSEELYPGAKKGIDEFFMHKEETIERLYGRCYIKKN